MAEVEIGRGKTGRRAYGFDDIAIVPSRRTRDPEDVDISWEIDAYTFDLPLMGSAMDGVISPTTAIEIGRLGGAVGNAAVVLLLVKHGIFRRLLAALAAVGQTALSNYLLTSILMQTLFVWSPLHWFGYLAYYQIYLVLLAMWAINLIVSPLWLRHFQFGPVEWLWRSLTYWKPQPMRLPTSA